MTSTRQSRWATWWSVLREGGRLAQFGPPAEVLANPASEFVARFVGADRGLKRLSLVRVGELELQKPITAHAGDDGASVRRVCTATRFPTCCCSTRMKDRSGWLSENDIPAAGALTPGMAQATSPLLDRQTTLKERCRCSSART